MSFECRWMIVTNSKSVVVLAIQALSGAAVERRASGGQFTAFILVDLRSGRHRGSQHQSRPRAPNAWALRTVSAP
jgi:hypothetical protein